MLLQSNVSSGRTEFGVEMMFLPVGAGTTISLERRALKRRLELTTK